MSEERAPMKPALGLVKDRLNPLPPRRNTTPAPRLSPALEEALADDPARAAVVGLVDDVVVGYGLMRAETLHDGAVLAMISDLYVSPRARGIGVGEAMMAELESRARAWGAIGLDGIVLPGDRESKNFFETFGLTARAILVHRSLEDE